MPNNYNVWVILVKYVPITNTKSLYNYLITILDRACCTRKAIDQCIYYQHFIGYIIYWFSRARRAERQQERSIRAGDGRAVHSFDAILPNLGENEGK